MALAALVVAPSEQTPITTPKQHFGFDLGDDYQLANYKQIADYWRKLDLESDRLTLQDIGKTAEGRPQLMAIVTSTAEMVYRTVSATDDETRRFLDECARHAR